MNRIMDELLGSFIDEQKKQMLSTETANAWQNEGLLNHQTDIQILKHNETELPVIAIESVLI